MPIKVSTAKHVDALLQDLRADDSLARDAAVARLMVIGTRAVDRLIALAIDSVATPTARAAAFRALEGIGDPRALPPALHAVTSTAEAHQEVAVAAVGLARTFLRDHEHGLLVLDALTTVALDRTRQDVVREAAVRAISVLDAATVGPIHEALLADPSPRLRAVAKGSAPESAEPAAVTASWIDQADGTPLPADPSAVRHEIVRRGAHVSLPSLLRTIERLREREQQVPANEQRAWLAARAAAHSVLARRGSRIALYDLREILERASGPMPWSDLLGAVAAIGDAPCLEVLAAIYAKTSAAPQTDAWHRQLVDAFQTIVAREKITARHAVAKRIKRRWPDHWATLWTPRS